MTSFDVSTPIILDKRLLENHNVVIFMRQEPDDIEGVWTRILLLTIIELVGSIGGHEINYENTTIYFTEDNQAGLKVQCAATNLQMKPGEGNDSKNVSNQ